MSSQPKELFRFLLFLSIAFLVAMVSQSLGLFIGIAMSVEVCWHFLQLNIRVSTVLLIHLWNFQTFLPWYDVAFLVINLWLARLVPAYKPTAWARCCGGITELRPQHMPDQYKINQWGYHIVAMGKMFWNFRYVSMTLLIPDYCNNNIDDFHLNLHNRIIIINLHNRIINFT